MSILLKSFKDIENKKFGELLNELKDINSDISTISLCDSNNKTIAAIVVMRGDDVDENLRKLEEDHPTCETCDYNEDGECVSDSFDKMISSNNFYTRLVTARDFYCKFWEKKDE